MGLCELWVADGIISGIFEVALESQEDLPLSTLAQRQHKELCPRKPAGLEKKDEGRWSVRSETPEQRVKDSSPGRRAGQSALRCQRAVRSQVRRHRAVNTMTSIFGSCVGFSQSSHDSHIYTQRMFISANFTFLHFAVLNPCLSFIPPTLCLLFGFYLFLFLRPVKCPQGRV